MDFILYRREGYALVGGVSIFKYLGKILEQMEDDLSAVRRNIKQAQRFWGRLGKLLRR